MILTSAIIALGVCVNTFSVQKASADQQSNDKHPSNDNQQQSNDNQQQSNDNQQQSNDNHQSKDTPFVLPVPVPFP